MKAGAIVVAPPYMFACLLNQCAAAAAVSLWIIGKLVLKYESVRARLKRFDLALSLDMMQNLDMTINVSSSELA